MNLPQSLQTKCGRRIRPGKEIASGGEGVIYALLDSPNEVLKVYRETRDLSEKRQKVEYMCRLYQPTLAAHTAWPIDVVDRPRLAILMPKVEGFELHDVYGPKSRMTKLPTAKHKFLVNVAYNLCAALEDIHATGAVVGDFNQRNILVGPNAQVVFIDCDSFQIQIGQSTFYCPVGMADYMAPEIQGLDLSKLVRTKNHDNFTLAVLIFQVLFLGRHPFAGTGGPDLELSESIRQHLYAYGPVGAARGIRPPPNTLPLDSVTKSMAKLFDRAFAPGSATVGRPSPGEWAKELRLLLENTAKCSVDSAHEFYAPRGKCTWCEIFGKARLTFFLGNAVQGFLGLGIEVEKMLSVIEYFVVPALPTVWPQIPPVSPSPPPNPEIYGARFQWLAILSAVFALGVFTEVYGLAVLAVAAAFAYLTLASTYWTQRREISALSTKAAQASKQISDLQMQLRAAHTSLQGRASAAKEQAKILRKACKDLPVERQKQLNALRANAREHQLQEYLDTCSISQARISGIGPNLLSRLRAYGIETAADITPTLNVSGIGYVKRSSLLHWKQQQEARFIFDPNKPLNSKETLRIDFEFSSKASDLEGKIRLLKDDLEKGSQDLSARIKQSLTAYKHIATERLQATIDREALLSGASAFVTPYAHEIAVSLAALAILVPVARFRLVFCLFSALTTWRAFAEPGRTIKPAWKWAAAAAPGAILIASGLAANTIWNHSSISLRVHSTYGTTFQLLTDKGSLTGTPFSSSESSPASTLQFEIPMTGSKTVSVKIPGYRVAQREVTGNPLSGDDWQLQLVREKGSLRPRVIDSVTREQIDPAKLAWSVDNVQTSLNGGMLADIPSGSHVVSAGSSEYFRNHAEAIVQDNSTSEITVIVKPKPAALHLDGIPAVPVQILADGKVLDTKEDGNGSVVVELPAHSTIALEIKAPGYVPETSKVTTGAGTQITKPFGLAAIPPPPPPPAQSPEQPVTPTIDTSSLAQPKLAVEAERRGASLTLDLKNRMVEIWNTGNRPLFLSSITFRYTKLWARKYVQQVGVSLSPGQHYTTNFHFNLKPGDTVQFESEPHLADSEVVKQFLP